MPKKGAAMNETENKFIVKRAEILAREFLTRRPEVIIHAFDDKNLHFVVTLDPSASLNIQGFSPLGVIVWGTDKVVSSEKGAASFATRRWKSEAEHSKSIHTYFMPVVALVFSVKEDVGYYAWISEPHFSSNGPPKLIPNENLDCTRIERISLDQIVEKVAEWYTRLATVVLLSA
jgi:hypothetical protein